MQDNFFELGGHSLKAIQVISRIRTQLGIQIPLRWVFESPTLSEFSARIDSEMSGVPKQKDVPLVKREVHLVDTQSAADGVDRDEILI